jgi:hypothetical protein
MCKIFYFLHTWRWPCRPKHVVWTSTTKHKTIYTKAARRRQLNLKSYWTIQCNRMLKYNRRIVGRVVFFPLRSVSYQRKVDCYFFPELLASTWSLHFPRLSLHNIAPICFMFYANRKHCYFISRKFGWLGRQAVNLCCVSTLGLLMISTETGKSEPPPLRFQVLRVAYRKSVDFRDSGAE